MGKGDRKTRRGKLFLGSRGKVTLKKREKVVIPVKPAAPPAEKKKPKAKKAT